MNQNEALICTSLERRIYQGDPKNRTIFEVVAENIGVEIKVEELKKKEN